MPSCILHTFTKKLMLQPWLISILMSLDRYHAVSVRFSITVSENCLCINCLCQAAMSDWLQVSLLFSSLGLLHIIFRTFLPELWPLIYATVVSAQYLENKLTEFHQIK